ncbi:MAG: glycosyltransferase family 4 protein [Candidatus Omnitrophica bacterium]|nr:glycosyltransferase family 4 protein [Candidatus Omnitrophota bacterium]
MKIALLVPAMDLGGVEQGTFDLACGFQKLGHQVLVISGPGRFIPLLHQKGIRWYPVPMERKNPFNFCRALRKIKRIFSEEKPDIIHSRSRFPAWLANFAVGSCAGHLITSIHGFHHSRRYSRIMGRGERVIVISEGLKEYAVGFLGADKEKVRVVYNGFDFAPFLKTTTRKNPLVQNKEEITVGAVGRLTAVQGFRYLLKAIALLSPDFPELKVVLVGSGPEETVLKNLAADLDLKSKVSFLKGKAADYLSSFNLMAVPNLNPEPKPEGGPFWSRRTGAEAQVAGIPVVTTMAGLAVGAFEIGEANIFTAARDPLGLSRAIKYIITHPAESRELAEKAKKIALEHFSLDRMVTRTLSVYQELLTDS